MKSNFVSRKTVSECRTISNGDSLTTSFYKDGEFLCSWEYPDIPAPASPMMSFEGAMLDGNEVSYAMYGNYTNIRKIITERVFAGMQPAGIVSFLTLSDIKRLNRDETELDKFIRTAKEKGFETHCYYELHANKNRVAFGIEKPIKELFDLDSISSYYEQAVVGLDYYSEMREQINSISDLSPVQALMSFPWNREMLHGYELVKVGLCLGFAFESVFAALRNACTTTNHKIVQLAEIDLIPNNNISYPITAESLKSKSFDELKEMLSETTKAMDGIKGFTPYLDAPETQLLCWYRDAICDIESEIEFRVAMIKKGFNKDMLVNRANLSGDRIMDQSVYEKLLAVGDANIKDHQELGRLIDYQKGCVIDCDSIALTTAGNVIISVACYALNAADRISKVIQDAESRMINPFKYEWTWSIANIYKMIADIQYRRVAIDFTKVDPDSTEKRKLHIFKSISWHSSTCLPRETVREIEEELLTLIKTCFIGPDRTFEDRQQAAFLKSWVTVGMSKFDLQNIKLKRSDKEYLEWPSCLPVYDSEMLVPCVVIDQCKFKNQEDDHEFFDWYHRKYPHAAIYIPTGEAIVFYRDAIQKLMTMGLSIVYPDRYVEMFTGYERIDRSLEICTLEELRKAEAESLRLAANA